MSPIADSADPRKALKVGLAVVIYCLSSAAVPIYNKKVFDGAAKGGWKKYPFPIATAFFQLGLCAVVLGVLNIISQLASPQKSWLLGPHLRYKLRHVAPVGLLFGFKYGITNLGLQLMPTSSHVLLQSTDLIWTIAFARIINREHPSALEYVAALLATAGSVLIGIQAGQTLNEPILPLMVNCLTPLMLALCVTTLRSAAAVLFDSGNLLGGPMSVAEFTALKLGLSAAVAFLLSMSLESGCFAFVNGKQSPWWTALAQEPAESVALLLLGSVWVLIFQLNISWLAGLTSAVTVGIVGGLKVVPQWILNALFSLKVDLSPLNICGATLVLLASALYASARFHAKRARERGCSLSISQAGSEGGIPFVQSDSRA
eukprot:TRINITY_DN2445_c0_g1_i1.p1 TRINITY_DN2445_c0_g1~~TRINITY_DN2445_c0_g1_i1.p1  ORF type:complete len:373 (+),score=49.57 TRINITY_DN2445_c0_g1_i1:159-1277(+)